MQTLPRSAHRPEFTHLSSFMLSNASPLTITVQDNV